MGIKSPANVEGPKTPKISPNILSSLGLTPKDVETADKKVIETREAGAKMYHELIEDTKTRASFEDAHRVTIDRTDLLVLGLGGHFNAETIPDELADVHLEGLDRGRREELRNLIKVYLEGYGTEALKTDDWRVALNAFDVATDGKVMEHKKLMDKLRGIARDNKTEGIEIAKTMQGRMEKRSSERAPQATPSAPTV